ncbi:DUF4345 family protein [Vibrio comitans]|uniref:DUF4345 domain-containing protein n=1 Tax=Vibrio comitans NBRC 102076 TaxID=1219078 RepID=A0A4Y3IHL1_9VIBR|nr:hypothetical protein [Vibrio comitans]GEA58826.1 hypothetical protein VCO01S_00190 [Vibrio comitans NBRC 102076]
MGHKIFLQVAGFIVLLLGAVLSYNPELVSSKPIPEDTFQAIERRVRWGFVMGIGMLLMFHHQVSPFLLTAAALGMTITIGALISRGIGIVIDGSSPRQWMWVVVELAMVIAFAVWYVKQRYHPA